ncbi:MAG: hypothetical protein JWO81_1541 [Alphaproteobacteria bacterium]|nr:hypothetical protein [Alphaproteobacteria bacterium]
METDRAREIERNYVAFQSAVAELSRQHEGEFALVRDGSVVSVHKELIDAAVAGQSSYPDGMYSIQEVTTKPLDLGFYSHANPSGPIC